MGQDNYYSESLSLIPMIKIISNIVMSYDNITVFCLNSPGTQEGWSPLSSRGLSPFGNAKTQAGFWEQGESERVCVCMYVCVYARVCSRSGVLGPERSLVHLFEEK